MVRDVSVPAPNIRVRCEHCSQPFWLSQNRPDWLRCVTCTFTPAPRRLLGGSQGATPDYQLPPATSDEVTFIVPGRPLSINRMHGIRWHNGRRQFFTTPEGRRYQDSVKAHALSALGTVHWNRTREYELTIVSFFDNRRADSDNPLKVIKDALQGVLWDNDVQVQSDHASKAIDKIAPRAVISVRALPPPEVAW